MGQYNNQLTNLRASCKEEVFPGPVLFLLSAMVITISSSAVILIINYDERKINMRIFGSAKKSCVHRLV